MLIGQITLWPTEYHAFMRHPQKRTIVLQIMLDYSYYARNYAAKKIPTPGQQSQFS